MSANLFEAHRGTNWRDSLDDRGRPTHGPAVADPGCDYCDGALVDGECPWCAARFPITQKGD